MVKTRTSIKMTRRSFAAGVVAATGICAVSAQQRSYEENAPPVRYPDPDIIVLDKSFAKYLSGESFIQRLFTGMTWAEGPAWSAGGCYLVWNDIPNNVKYRWLADDGHVSVLQKPSNHGNGNTYDWQGRLISCENDTHSVVRYEHDGTVTVLAESWQGKPLNEPNDVVVHPNGGIWFTDAGYGSLSQGGDLALSIKEAVYRVDAKTGNMDMVTDAMFKPNGLCFSPDYKRLYIAETGQSNYPAAPRNIMVFDVVDGQKLKGGKEFASMKLKSEDSGGSDGIRADADGNIWASAGWAGSGYDGVHVFAPDGQRIGQILLPEVCANVCFGGEKRNRLFMTASQSLYAVYLNVRGAGCA